MLRVYLVGFGFIVLLGMVVLLAPASRFARALRSAMGPSLDAKNQTRSQCLKSALGFLRIGLTALALDFVLHWVGYAWVPTVADTVWFGTISFTLALFFGMGLLGAVFLVVRARFRPGGLESTSDEHEG